MSALREVIERAKTEYCIAGKVAFLDLAPEDMETLIAAAERALAWEGATEATLGERGNEYRDLLELWVRWWNGPGRQGYRDPVIPPLTRTASALSCVACPGVSANEAAPQERCAACGRRFGGAK